MQEIRRMGRANGPAHGGRPDGETHHHKHPGADGFCKGSTHPTGVAEPGLPRG
jgi:hypothetical protein